MVNPFPALPELKFREDPHEYKLDGAIIPSVTHIMRFMSRELYDGIPADVLAHAAERGTLAHEQTANIDIYGFKEADEETAPYIRAYKRFLADFNPHWTAVEWRGYHKNLLYAGTIDRAGYLNGGDDGTGVDLVDLKCTAAFHPIMLSVQLAGYAEILQSHGIRVRARYGLQLKRDGGYTFQKVEDGKLIFLNCLSLHNAMARERRPQVKY